MQTRPEPLFLADDGTYVDVTNFVRFELQHGDIRYGVLDLIVHFHLSRAEGAVLFTAFFPVDAVKENVNTPFPEWTEGFRVSASPAKASGNCGRCHHPALSTGLYCNQHSGGHNVCHKANSPPQNDFARTAPRKPPSPCVG